MTVAAPNTTRSRSGKKADAPILLSCDDGGWALIEQDHPARQFPNFEDALESARQVPDWTKSTIEIWRGGQYICYLPPQAWRPRPKASIHAPPPSGTSTPPPLALVVSRWPRRQGSGLRQQSLIAAMKSA